MYTAIALILLFVYSSLVFIATTCFLLSNGISAAFSAILLIFALFITYTFRKGVKSIVESPE